MRKILVVIDRYSDAILMAPLIRRLRLEPSLQPLICLSAPPQEGAVQALNGFGILAGANANQILQETAGRESIDQAILRHRPDCVMVHGAGASSITSFPVSVPWGNVDAGLRMYELGYTAAAQGTAGVIAKRFFVTSETSLDNLLRLGVPAGEIYLTGDLAIDAVRMAIERVRDDKCLNADLAASFPFVDPAKRLILVIGHRRENCGGGLEGVCRALRRLATRPDVHVAYPVPSSPIARSVVEESFINHPGVTLMGPQDYLRWIYLMQAAYLILADSGDTPKEALAMGKPVLVMRDVAERPEVIDAGAIRLVGTDAERILRECTLFLDDPSYDRAFSSHRNPYGDGLASQRIVEMLLR